MRTVDATEFAEILNTHLMPFFPNAKLGEAALYNPSTRKELVVQEGQDSARKLLLKPSDTSTYRLRLERSQPFSKEEKGLIGVFLKVLGERDLPTSRVHRHDTLTSVVNETVAGFASSEAKEFLLDLLNTLAEWAQQTYEGERVAFSGGILENDYGIDSNVSFSDIKGDDFIKVLGNAQDTLLVFAKRGQLLRHETFEKVFKGSELSSNPPKRFAPIRFDGFARWTSLNYYGVAVVLSRNGEILIFRRGDLLFAKRRGIWHFFPHEACIKQFTKGIARSSSPEFREEVYLTALDVAFSRSGGCICVLRKELENSGRSHIDKSDSIASGADIKSLIALKKIIGNYKFQELPRLLRSELVAIDGSTVLDYEGKILAAGAILRIDSRSRNGGGRQAATECLSKYGLGIKISNDGYIRAMADKKEIFEVG